jgi:hypothetical protein
MTTVHGQALRMKLELARLARDRGVPNETHGSHLPLLAPVEGPAITVEGLASPAGAPDLERTRFGPYCWMPFPDRFNLNRSIPLTIRHTRTVAGEIIDLRAREDGLWLRARVTDPTALCLPAFSVVATVHSYSIRNADGPDYYALVTAATIDAIALTDRPAHPGALIVSRHPPRAGADLYADIAERIAALRSLFSVNKLEAA